MTTKMNLNGTTRKALVAAIVEITGKILGIDEPFRGLGSSEIYKVSIFLNHLVDKGKTVVVVDHSEPAERYFCRKIILVNKNGILCD